MDRRFKYHFHTPTGIVSYEVDLDQPAAAIIPEEPEPWTLLAFKQCEGCVWVKSDRCPVALRLQTPSKLLGTLPSHAPMRVVVEGPERTYEKETTAQDGLSSLFGLLIGSSDCQAFARFKGLAWFHLPFASFEETLMRILSSYAMANIFFSPGKHVDKPAAIAEIQALYRILKRVNIGITTRLRQGAALASDSPMNAIIILDSNAQLVDMSVEDEIVVLQKIFAPSEM